MVPRLLISPLINKKQSLFFSLVTNMATGQASICACYMLYDYYVWRKVTEPAMVLQLKENN